MEKDELKQFREKLGLTQTDLAKLLKVATNTVSRWELGERKIPEFLDLALKTIERERKEKIQNLLEHPPFEDFIPKSREFLKQLGFDAVDEKTDEQIAEAVYGIGLIMGDALQRLNESISKFKAKLPD